MKTHASKVPSASAPFKRRHWDTIRVSLTEDPIHEIPVAQALAQKAMKLWEKNSQKSDTDSSQNSDTIDPYSFTRNATQPIELNASCAIGATHPPRIVIKAHHTLKDYPTLIQSICKHQIKPKKINSKDFS